MRPQRSATAFGEIGLRPSIGGVSEMKKLWYPAVWESTWRTVIRFASVSSGSQWSIVSSRESLPSSTSMSRAVAVICLATEPRL